MPGKLVLVRVVDGQKVVKGQEVAVMEAMKMELSIKATADGIITGLLNEPGTVIDADSAILSWESSSV
jgi:biotin carboxyl carrier protein